MFIPNPFFRQALEAEIETRNAMYAEAEKAGEEAMKIRHHIMPNPKGKAGSRPAIHPKWIGKDLYLVNTDAGGHLDEWGSINNPAYAPLRNGVRRAGFDLIEE